MVLKVDKKSKAILGHIKLETRGLVYLEEVRYIHRIIIKKTKEVYEATVKDVPDMEEKDLIKIIRTDLEKSLADPDIYTEANKESLKALLLKKRNVDAEIEVVEMAWMEASEEYEQAMC